MHLCAQIEAAMDGANLSEDLDDLDPIDGLVEGYGWESVQTCLLDILSDNGRPAYWQRAMEVFWGAVLDKRSVPADKLIALLYYRFDPQGLNENNLVWSITSKLKGMEYLSEYRPLDDPGVQLELAALRGAA
jgi:hypothetical protein